MLKLLSKLFGSKHQRDVALLKPLVDRINQIEVEYQSLTDDQLKAKTAEMRAKIAAGATVESVTCEAFAAVKNACRRLVGAKVNVCGHELTWDMVPYDVQLIGGLVLCQGKIAEMATGEGKTLVATLPLYLHALSGKNVNLVTVNDYLAKRDSQWMGNVFNFLGVSVGCIQNQMTHAERKDQYSRDITYGTNSEFGFDYLRDNGMAFMPESQVQRDHYFALVDEVDSILIDEARTPLIISGPAPVSTHQYRQMNPKVEELFKKQRALCNRLVQEAKDMIDKMADEKDSSQARDLKEKIQLCLYQVHQGMPKHKQLMHMMEEPSTRKMMEDVDNMMLTDMRKEQARRLREELFFTIDERGHDVGLTEKGCETLNPSEPDMYILPDLVSAMAEIDGEDSLSDADKLRKRQEIQALYADRIEKIHNIDQLIKAYCLYEKDVEYVIQDNQVLIVDEYTGRILPGRRWSDGLHQAVEAKEGVQIERETQTLATITIQNYFRMYSKLAGMTGTAETEASEFNDIYKLDVVVIPTNRPIRRMDFNDVIYKTQREKFKAVVDEIVECNKRGQPVLVGTITVETSELISRMLRRFNIPHNVLNAKNHEREAEIVSRAGQLGAVTIATNMAGRGTDIKLAPEVIHIERNVIQSNTRLEDKVNGTTLKELILKQPSGLHVLGSERHESRRIDRQLRGRCARQGDPGTSRFYISLEDDLMRLFGSGKIADVMTRFGLEEGQQLEARLLNRSIETAQRRVEQHNFSIRKKTLEYDNVMNKQREIIYSFRGSIVRSENVREKVYDVLHDVIISNAEKLLDKRVDESAQTFVEWLLTMFPLAVSAKEIVNLNHDPELVAKEMFDRVRKAYDLKISFEDNTAIAMMERQIMLMAIDNHWQEYLRSMDALRHGVALRAYGQRDPLVEYKREAFTMFDELMTVIKNEIASSVFRTSTSLDNFQSFMHSLPKLMLRHDEVSTLGGGHTGPGGEDADESDAASDKHSAALPVTREEPKVGRNDPCICGSGKKYKKCCGK